MVKNNLIYVVTRDQTGKIKRLRNNQKIKFATCNIKGKVSSQFTEGTAEILSDTESKTSSYLERQEIWNLLKDCKIF